MMMNRLCQERSQCTGTSTVVRSLLSGQPTGQKVKSAKVKPPSVDHVIPRFSLCQESRC